MNVQILRNVTTHQVQLITNRPVQGGYSLEAPPKGHFLEKSHYR
jgi:hypothetical protein